MARKVRGNRGARQRRGRQGKRGTDKARQGKKVIGKGRQHKVEEMRQGMGRVGKSKLVIPRQDQGWPSPIRGLQAEMLGHSPLTKKCFVRDSSLSCLGEFSDQTSSQGQNCNKIL